MEIPSTIWTGLAIAAHIIPISIIPFAIARIQAVETAITSFAIIPSEIIEKAIILSAIILPAIEWATIGSAGLGGKAIVVWIEGAIIGPPPQFLQIHSRNSKSSDRTANLPQNSMAHPPIDRTSVVFWRLSGCRNPDVRMNLRPARGNYGQ